MNIWALNGILVEEYFIWEGSNDIKEIGLNGVYLLEFIFEDGYREIKQVCIN